MPVPSSTDRLLHAMHAVPALYFGTLVVAAMLYPGCSHMAQFASELGSHSARYPMVFNAGTLMGGVAGLAAAGMHRGLRSVGTGHALAVLLALVVAANGIAFLFGGWFPLPDHRHTACNLGPLVLLGSPLAALAMHPGSRHLVIQRLDVADHGLVFKRRAVVVGVVDRHQILRHVRLLA